MPYLLNDLVINRVDLVDEGANSAAFIELYKRKERKATMEFNEIISKMKPEHVEVIEAELEKAKAESTEVVQDMQSKLDTANDELAKANSELETLKAAACAAGEGDGDLEDTKKADDLSFDEEETIKSLPEGARALLAKMKSQKDVAEEELRKSKEAETLALAKSKAAELKALPVSADKLVEVLKGSSPEMVEMLTSMNAALEGVVLGEVGKSNAGSVAGSDAWAKIEAKADEIVKADTSNSVTKQKAITTVIKENPDLYKEYLQGGAN